MQAKRKQRLILIIATFCCFALACGLVLYALRQNINLFYSPTQVNAGLAPAGHSFRLGGMVQAGSIHHEPHSLRVNFTLSDGNDQVEVHYDGILPDLFAAGQGIVTEGQLNASGEFMASQVLAKHGANYMPREVAAIMRRPHVS